MVKGKETRFIKEHKILNNGLSQGLPTIQGSNKAILVRQGWGTEQPRMTWYGPKDTPCTRDILLRCIPGVY